VQKNKINSVHNSWGTIMKSSLTKFKSGFHLGLSPWGKTEETARQHFFPGQEKRETEKERKEKDKQYLSKKGQQKNTET